MRGCGNGPKGGWQADSRFHVKGANASRFAVTVETVESVEATHGPERRRPLLHVWSTRRAKSNVKLYYCTLVSQAPVPNIFFYLLIHNILTSNNTGCPILQRHF